jgi:hypothetical protein
MTLHTTMIGTRALPDRQEPLSNTVPHDLLQILEGSAQIERVLARQGVENGEDMALAGGGGRGVRLVCR